MMHRMGGEYHMIGDQSSNQGKSPCRYAFIRVLTLRFPPMAINP